MYFGAGVSKLGYAIKALRQSWDRTEDDWRDAVRDDFGREHIEPALEMAAKTHRAMDQIADLMARIQRDCS